MTKTDFATVFGVDRAQPTRWEKLGMPVLPDGKVDPVAAAQWVHANVDATQREARRAGGENAPPKPSKTGTFLQERTRVAHARANALEMANAVRRGELISRDVAESVLFETSRAARDAWMNWPVVTGPLLATDLGVDAEKITVALVGYVHRQLVALGEPEVDFMGPDHA